MKEGETKYMETTHTGDSLIILNCDTCSIVIRIAHFESEPVKKQVTDIPCECLYRKPS
jgi:hypothetical protein